MAFKVLILAATLAFAHAGDLIGQHAAVATYSSAPAVSSSYFHQASAPVAVAHAAPVAYAAQAPLAVAHSAPIVAAHSAPIVSHSVHAPSVGYSEQNVARSLGGGQSVSTYSKAVDSAFSSVRKYDTRITNDGLSLAPALYAKSYAAPIATTYAHSAPVAYSQPILAKSYTAPAHLAYSAPVVAKSYAAPAHLAYSAPVVTKAYSAAAPVAYAQPAQYAYAQPTQYTYSQPTQYAYSQPAQYAYAHQQPAHLIAKQVAPVATYAASGPVLAKTAVSYSPAAVVAHTNFEGYGISYHY